MGVRVALAAAVACGSMVAEAAGMPALEVAPRHVLGRDVAVTVVNRGASALRLEGPWRVERAGAVVATKEWRDRSLAPGESRTWRWDQQTADGRAGPGRYAVVVPTRDGTLTDGFAIGRYYTIGFNGSDSTFVVFTHLRDAIRAMDAEARADDKRLIVSGIVRGARRYNRPWSYTMGPATIVLAEVFTEVCDASPEYVEANRDAWLGERWCPWSSYVAARGR